MVRERSFGNPDFTKYYDPKLGSDYNLDKGLSNKRKEKSIGKSRIQNYIYNYIYLIVINSNP